MIDLKSYNSIYITTTLPYVNASPHVGFAMEIIRADVIARYFISKGKDVFFNTGTDEHGQKIYTKALESGISPKDYVDGYAEEFMNLSAILNLLPSLKFIRTTDKDHIKACQEIWKKCRDNGYIYKAKYETKYCVGCEMEKTDSDLVSGVCPEHPKLKIKKIDEENYFFKFSSFRDSLLKLYKDPEFLFPDIRYNEVQTFVRKGLKDFSISRLKDKMPWGVSVPGDEEHVMYVWFDALTNYISTLGWPDDKQGDYKKFWESGFTIQYAGKDNLRQQAAMWQAMLLAAGLPNTKKIVINGFITADQGMKMSKSLGNIINPYDLVNKYGTDALRYYLLRHIQSFEDTSMTTKSFHESYNGNLVNGLGNLVNRIITLSQNNHIEYKYDSELFVDGLDEYILNFELQKAIDKIWQEVDSLGKFLSKEEPYKTIKLDRDKGSDQVRFVLNGLNKLANSLSIFLPSTSDRIKNILIENKKPESVLFSRVENIP